MDTGLMPLALLRDATRNSVMKSVTALAIFIYLICIPHMKKFLLKLNVSKSFPLCEDLEREVRVLICFFISAWAGPSKVPDRSRAHTRYMNGFRRLCNLSWLPFGFGSQETQSQVTGALVPCCWLESSLSDPGSQPADLTQWLEERTDEDKDLCLGHKAGWEVQEDSVA